MPSAALVSDNSQKVTEGVSSTKRASSFGTVTQAKRL